MHAQAAARVAMGSGTLCRAPYARLSEQHCRAPPGGQRRALSDTVEIFLIDFIQRTGAAGRLSRWRSNRQRRSQAARAGCLRPQPRPSMRVGKRCAPRRCAAVAGAVGGSPACDRATYRGRARQRRCRPRRARSACLSRTCGAAVAGVSGQACEQPGSDDPCALLAGTRRVASSATQEEQPTHSAALICQALAASQQQAARPHLQLLAQDKQSRQSMWLDDTRCT